MERLSLFAINHFNGEDFPDLHRLRFCQTDIHDGIGSLLPLPRNLLQVLRAGELPHIKLYPERPGDIPFVSIGIAFLFLCWDYPIKRLPRIEKCTDNRILITGNVSDLPAAPVDSHHGAMIVFVIRFSQKCDTASRLQVLNQFIRAALVSHTDNHLMYQIDIF